MENDFYTKQEILDIVENEGLEYAFCDYMSLERIEDSDLRSIATDIKNCRIKIENILSKYESELEGD